MLAKIFSNAQMDLFKFLNTLGGKKVIKLPKCLAVSSFIYISIVIAAAADGKKHNRRRRLFGKYQTRFAARKQCDKIDFQMAP